MVRCMLADSGFASSICGELLVAVAYLKNRTPHKALKMKTPFKTLHGKKDDLSYIHVLGTRTSVHIKESRKIDTLAW